MSFKKPLGGLDENVGLGDTVRKTPNFFSKFSEISKSILIKSDSITDIIIMKNYNGIKNNADINASLTVVSALRKMSNVEGAEENDKSFLRSVSVSAVDDAVFTTAMTVDATETTVVDVGSNEIIEETEEEDDVFVEAVAMEDVDVVAKDAKSNNC